jgi:hypothetical protein
LQCGRSISVFNGTVVSAIGAAACCISAFAGTLIPHDNNEETIRKKANDACKVSLKNSGYKIINENPVSEENAPVAIKSPLTRSVSFSSFFYPFTNENHSLSNDGHSHETLPYINDLRP